MAMIVCGDSVLLMSSINEAVQKSSRIVPGFCSMSHGNRPARRAGRVAFRCSRCALVTAHATLVGTSAQCCQNI
jgi:hypothetical protein